MIGARQRIGHMTVVGHPTNLDVWSVTIHKVLLVLQPANHNAGVRPCGCWSNNNIVCLLAKQFESRRCFKLLFLSTISNLYE